MTNSFDERSMPVSSGMVWQAVDSSQITEIGYDGGADYPLGIKFPPNKKQKASGEPGSEYHYANVTPEMHAEFLAADSIGSHFGKHIKPFADLYPYVKVEAENPPQPPSSPNGGGSHSAKSSTSSDPAETSPETSATNTGSTLAVIDSMPAEKLFTPGGVTDAQIAAGRERYLAEAKKYGIETEEKRTELKRFARPLQKLRTGIEARAKEYTGETKRKLAAIDTEKRRLVLLVGGIEDEVLRPLTEWEAEEEARKVRLSGIANELSAKGQRVYMDMAEIEKAIAELEDFDTSTMQEYKASAESSIATSLRVLKPELARRQEAERNAAELAELRRKQAERDEEDRQAEQKRREDARIAEAAEKLAARRLEEMQQEVMKRDEKAALLEMAEDEPEDSPELVQAVQPFVYQEILAPPTLSHKQAIHAEVVEALMGCALTRQEALAVLQAIVDGNVPHLTITY